MITKIKRRMGRQCLQRMNICIMYLTCLTRGNVVVTLVGTLLMYLPATLVGALLMYLPVTLVGALLMYLPATLVGTLLMYLPATLVGTLPLLHHRKGFCD